MRIVYAVNDLARRLASPEIVAACERPPRPPAGLERGWRTPRPPPHPTGGGHGRKRRRFWPTLDVVSLAAALADGDPGCPSTVSRPVYRVPRGRAYVSIYLSISPAVFSYISTSWTSPKHRLPPPRRAWCSCAALAAQVGSRVFTRMEADIEAATRTRVPGQGAQGSFRRWDPPSKPRSSSRGSSAGRLPARAVSAHRRRRHRRHGTRPLLLLQPRRQASRSQARRVRPARGVYTSIPASIRRATPWTEGLSLSFNSTSRRSPL